MDEDGWWKRLQAGSAYQSDSFFFAALPAVMLGDAAPLWSLLLRFLNQPVVVSTVTVYRLSLKWPNLSCSSKRTFSLGASGSGGEKIPSGRFWCGPAWVDFLRAFLMSSSCLLLSFTSSCCVFTSRSFCRSARAFRAWNEQNQSSASPEPQRGSRKV